MAATGVPPRPRLTVAELFPFVALEFSHAIGPPPGRYPVELNGAPERDVLQIAALGAPPPSSGIVFRRAKRAHPDDPPREASLLVVTLIGAANRFVRRDEARAFLGKTRSEPERQDELVDQALAATNRAIRAFRGAARDPFVAEVERADARAVRIGFGSAQELAAGRWAEAFSAPPPPAPRLSRAERVAPEEAVAFALTGRLPLLDAEDLALRAMLDLERGRTRSAAVQLRACIDLLVAELTDAGDAFSPPRDELEEHARRVALLAELALDDRLDAAAVEELRAHLDRVEDALGDWRAWHDPQDGR